MTLNDEFRFALAVVMFILAVIDQFMARGRSLVSWSLIAGSVALMSAWWPADG